MNANGCDSTATINLSILEPSTSHETIEACKAMTGMVRHILSQGCILGLLLMLWAVILQRRLI